MDMRTLAQPLWLHRGLYDTSVWAEYFTIVMSCVMQFCICDLVQHEIEYGQTDGRTDGHIVIFYTTSRSGAAPSPDPELVCIVRTIVCRVG